MASKEKQSEEAIQNYEQADDGLAEIGEMQAQLAKICLRGDRDIAEIKERVIFETKPIKEAIKLRTAELRKFCTKHKKEFGDDKSKKLTHGCMGWRRSGRISIGKNVAALVARIKSSFDTAKQKSLLIIKEDINRAKLRTLTDEELALIGVQRKGKESFFVEPDHLTVPLQGRVKE